MVEPMNSTHVKVHEEVDLTIPAILPHDKVYVIQVGYKMFRLSGASILSDGPSYFTTFFGQEANAEKVLFIDRSPVIFEKIYSHLQGYHVSAETEEEFLHLWLDAYYFCLKRLKQVLEDECSFATVGATTFRIPRSLLELTGNYPNFFLINYDTLLFNSKLLIMSKLMIRPPPQKVVGVSGRSPLLFADLLEILRGNTLVIRDDEHRQLLAKECRYYRFLELEQRLLRHRIVHNPFTGVEEIIMDLNDLSKKGIFNASMGLHDERPLTYARPLMKKEPRRNLIVQIESASGSDVLVVLNSEVDVSVAVFTNKIAQKVRNLFEDIYGFEDDASTGKLKWMCTLEGASVTINGMEMKENWYVDFFPKKAAGEEPEEDDEAANAKKRKLSRSTDGNYVNFKLTKSMWRVLQRGDRAMLQAVSMNGLSSNYFFNKNLGFL